MKISGFSFVRNGVKLYYPVAESIVSILPIVDEFVVAVGKGDPDDATLEVIRSIGDPKVRVIETVWDERYFVKGAINAVQTDIAKNACTGDWLFYLQADEVAHEKDLPAVRARCEELADKPEVEGLLFRYRHFWGDYGHFHDGHGWYPFEVRVVRNRPDIHSWQSAQSFRSFSRYEHPRQPDGHRPLRVAKVDATIYHYGWVRPPRLMQNKKRALDSVHWGLRRAASHYEAGPAAFDYGPMDRLAVFTGTHPAVMKDRISRLDWTDQLQKDGKPDPRRQPHKHELLKYRFLSFIEKRVLGGRPLGGFRNYRLLKKP